MTQGLRASQPSVKRRGLGEHRNGSGSGKPGEAQEEKGVTELCGQKTWLNRETVKALWETSDSNHFTGFRISSEVVAKFRAQTIISPSGRLAHQAAHR